MSRENGSSGDGRGHSAGESRPALPGRRRPATWVCLAVVVLALGAGGWHAMGQLRQARREEDLRLLREQLLTLAEATGRYPDQLSEAISKAGLADRLDVSELGFEAGGTPYDPHGYQPLFYEYRSRWYGFERGRYYVWQHARYFLPVD